MKLRRAVRTSIQRGTQIYATVEEYALGRATVRLAPNGARLTNLSTLGKEVEPGDRVIVDYSAGVEPIIRPEFITIEERELEPTSEDTMEEIPEAGEQGDHGCYVVREGSYEDNVKAYNGTPLKIPFSTNYPEWPQWPVFWDTDDHHDYVDSFGRDYIVIKHPGKYHLFACWCDYMQQTMGIEPWSGWMRVRILVNDQPVAVRYMYVEVGDYTNPGPQVSCFWPLEEGDHVSLELTQTCENGEYWFDQYGGAMVDKRALCVQFLPGTLVP
jgi:hypothetical protein